MKIDLANPAIRFLVGGANLADGCSVIRNALLRSTLVLGAVAIAAIAAVIVGFIITGLTLYLAAPWFDRFDVGLSLSYLGNAWWADFLRFGAFIGVLLSCMGTALGVVFGALFLLRKMLKRVSIKTYGLGDRIRESAPMKALTFVGTAAYNVAHQICPKVELKLDVEAGSLIDRIMNDPAIRVRLVDSYYSERVMRVVKIIPTVGYIRVNLTQEDDPDITDFFYYNLKSHQFSEGVEIVCDAPAEEQATEVIDQILVELDKI